MSLNLYIKDCFMPTSEIDIVRDVESAIIPVDIYREPMTSIFLRDIEQAKPITSEMFVDRFGGRLYYNCLSTGCKAAICVASMPDKLIDLIECGPNAIESILRNCNHGNVLLQGFNSSIGYTEEDKIDIQCNGYRFTKMAALNKYLLNDIEDDLNAVPSCKGGWELV